MAFLRPRPLGILLNPQPKQVVPHLNATVKARDVSGKQPHRGKVDLDLARGNGVQRRLVGFSKPGNRVDQKL